MRTTVATLLVMLLAFVLVLAAAPATGAATFQDEINNTTETETGERIDSDLELLSSSYDSEGGTATLTFRSDGATAVTLADAGGFVNGGEITRRTVVLQDGRNSVQLPVTETDAGYVGVTIATQEVLYGEVINTQQMLFPGLRSQYSGGMLAASVVIAAMVGVGTMVVLLVTVGKHLKKRKAL